MSKQASKDPIRLSKLMSQRNLCSRREADRLIEAGQVLVNDVLVNQLGSKVDPDCKIVIKSQKLDLLDKRTTVILNKPLGLVSSQPENDYQSAMTLLRAENRCRTQGTKQKVHMQNLAPAGRLDINSKGLIIYTNDGRVAKAIIGPQNEIDKEYFVQFHGELSEKVIRRLSHGLKLDGQALKPSLIEKIDAQTIKMTLNQGKKRQIRRMLKLVNLDVTHLKRLRVGPISLGDLEVEQWRPLNEEEINSLLQYKLNWPQ